MLSKLICACIDAGWEFGDIGKGKTLPTTNVQLLPLPGSTNYPGSIQ